MRDQLHLRNSLESLDFSKIIYCFEEPDVHGDRVGGFWTSSYIPGLGSEWIQKKIYKPLAHVYKGYLFSVKTGTRIYEVRSQKDELYFKDYYKSNYNKVARDFHGLRIDSEYLKEIKKK